MHLLGLLAFCFYVIISAQAAALPQPRASAGCAFSCPPSDRTNHAVANTVRKGGFMECYYGSSGVCAYNSNAGKLSKAKSTNGNCRPNAIASCARRRAKTKNAKKDAQKQKQVQGAILIQRAPTPTQDVQSDEAGRAGRRGHDDV